MENFSIKIEYWGVQKDKHSIHELDGISDFKNELDKHYVNNVRGLPGDLGGGLYELAVEFITNIDFSDVATFLLEGVTYDLIKSGVKSFAIRPFLDAYKKLRSKNKRVDFYRFVFCFNDTKIILYNLYKNSIEEAMEKIFSQLSIHYQSMLKNGVEFPAVIHIPVLHDETMNDYSAKFRVKLDVDETVDNLCIDNYFDYWGLSYYYSREYVVYSLKDKRILEDKFLDENMYECEFQIIN
jgi:hypothetical protein